MPCVCVVHSGATLSCCIGYAPILSRWAKNWGPRSCIPPVARFRAYTSRDIIFVDSYPPNPQPCRVFDFPRKWLSPRLLSWLSGWSVVSGVVDGTAIYTRVVILSLSHVDLIDRAVLPRRCHYRRTRVYPYLLGRPLLRENAMPTLERMRASTSARVREELDF